MAHIYNDLTECQLMKLKNLLSSTICNIMLDTYEKHLIGSPHDCIKFRCALYETNIVKLLNYLQDKLECTVDELLCMYIYLCRIRNVHDDSHFICEPRSIICMLLIMCRKMYDEPDFQFPNGFYANCFSIPLQLMLDIELYLINNIKLCIDHDTYENQLLSFIKLLH